MAHLITEIAPVIVTPPTVTPVSLEEAKSQCRVDHDEDDALITHLIEASTSHVERYLNQKLITQTWRAYFDEFEEALLLPFGPAQSITQITYWATLTTEEIVSSNLYDLHHRLDSWYVHVRATESWPDTADREHAVSVYFVAGYGDPEDVPAEIKQSILMFVSELYERREVTVLGQTVQTTGAMEALMSTHRIFFI